MERLNFKQFINWFQPGFNYRRFASHATGNISEDYDGKIGINEHLNEMLTNQERYMVYGFLQSLIDSNAEVEFSFDDSEERHVHEYSMYFYIDERRYSVVFYTDYDREYMPGIWNRLVNRKPTLLLESKYHLIGRALQEITTAWENGYYDGDSLDCEYCNNLEVIDWMDNRTLYYGLSDIGEMCDDLYYQATDEAWTAFRLSVKYGIIMR